ncbi:MAG: molybdopterin-dependent oxidoreductase [Acidimicrobiales bacterium]
MAVLTRDVDEGLDDGGPPDAGRRRVSRGRGALSGFLGAGAALLVIELVSLVDATAVTVTGAVQNRFIADFAASLKQTAIDLFGRNDKVALQLGTAVVVLLIGAAVGAFAVDRWRIVVGAFAAFAVLGIVLALGDPLAPGALSVAAAVLGAVVGAAVVVGLERRWRRPLAEGRGTASGLAAADRRQVLTQGGLAALALLVGATAVRGARSSMRHVRTVAGRVLPRPVRRVTVPASQPFHVEGLSPFVTPTGDFYRIDISPEAPVVDADGWEVAITGRVDKELRFSYDDLLARDLIEVPITMQCVSNEVGGDLIGTARWTGIPLATLLREAGVKAGADQVVAEAVDGFTAGFPIEAALDGRQALLVVGMNGHPLTTEHGFPARLVVPGLYGYVSATKWLKEIRLTTFGEEQGFWIPRGWARLGPIKTQSRIDVPAPGAKVSVGRNAIAGVAWAPTRGIKRVEVSIDDGPWQRAELGRVTTADTWVQWRLAWDATAGDHTIAVRATDGKGKVQTASPAPPDPDGATGHDTIAVAVA